MYTFSVVIDHARNPKASTGLFECVYRQIITSNKIRGNKAKTLVVNGTAIPLQLQFHGKLLDKAPEVLASRGSNLNIFSELDSEYISLNVIKQSVNNVPSNLNQENNRDAFKTYTETKARAQQDNNSSFNFMIKEPCGDFARTALNVIAESDKGKAGTTLGWQHLNLNTDMEIGSYATNVKTELYDYMDLNSKRELCTYYMTCPKSNQIAKLHNTDLLKFGKDKEPNITTELDNHKHLDLTLADSKKSDASKKTQTDINARSYPNDMDRIDNYLIRNLIKDTCTYTRHPENAKLEPNNDNHL